MKKKASVKPVEKWVMLDWMEQYRGLIGNTGGNPIEELMNDHTTNVDTNVVRSMLCVSVKSQVSLLMRLHNGKLLANDWATCENKT